MKTKKYLAATLCLLIFAVFTAQKNEKPDWKELRGDHFIVYHVGKDGFAQEVLRKAEEYYRRIGTDLGYERRSNFWQWDNRVKIYVYETQEDYIEETGRQSWSHGFADYDNKIIYSYEWKQGFLESLLPHEITHLIFRDFVGKQGEVPTWLDEGVAQWEEVEKRNSVREMMRFYLKDGKGYSLKGLTTVDIQNVSNQLAVQIFYVQAASIVDFLVARYGSEQFIFFCRQLRDGKDIDEALRFAYPTKLSNSKEMEEEWKEYIKTVF